MARVNLENRLFGEIRVGLLGKMMRNIEFDLRDRALGLGILAILWHESQEKLAIDVTFDEFASFFSEFAGTNAANALLNACLKTGFAKTDEKLEATLAKAEGKLEATLAKAEHNSSLIKLVGNAEQVAAIRSYKERGAKGGSTKKQTKKHTKKHKISDEKIDIENNHGTQLTKNVEADALAEVNSSLATASTTTTTTTTTTTKEELINKFTDHSHDPLSDGVNPPGQEKNHPALLANSPKPEKSKKEKPAGEVSDGSKVWTAYAMAYEQRMRVPPIRNAKQNALCSQLVQRLGVENAVKIAAFYLTHPNSFYMQNKYPLGLLDKDCEGIYTEFQRGEYVTADRARKASISQQNSSVLEKFIARKQERESRGL